MSQSFYDESTDTFVVGTPPSDVVNDTDMYVVFSGVYNDLGLIRLTEWASSHIEENLIGTTTPTPGAIQGVTGVQQYMRDRTGDPTGPWDKTP